MSEAEQLRIRRVYPHTRTRVFDAFSSADAVSRWLAPADGIRTDVRDFNFCEGGSYRIDFHLPEGPALVLRGAYERIVSGSEIVLTWSWDAPDPHAGIESKVTAIFADHPGGTSLVIHHERLHALGMKPRHEDGWNGTLARLGVFLERAESVSQEATP